jgi:hypothetical protein
LSLNAHAHGSGYRLCAHLSHQIGPVDFDGAAADAEVISNASRRKARLNSLQDLRLSCRERLELPARFLDLTMEVDDCAELLSCALKKSRQIVVIERGREIAYETLQEKLRAAHRIERPAEADYGIPSAGTAYVVQQVAEGVVIITRQD